VKANTRLIQVISILIFALICVSIRGQGIQPPAPVSISTTDTMSVSLPEAESILIKNNLYLLARRYDIETARAQVLQAKLWDNPVFYVETNPLNNSSGRYFSFIPANNFNPNDKSTIGNEVIANVNQLIKTAGKRSNLVQLNRINAEISEFVFADAIRSLKYTLRYDYSLMVQFQKSIDLLDNESRSIKVLVDIIQEQLLKGNFAEKDLLRLQALAFDLQMQRKDFLKQLADVEAEVRTLLGVRTVVFIKPIADSTIFKRTIPDRVDSLVSSALDNRPDLKMSESQFRWSSQNLKLQKSLSVPDVAVTLNYTRYSNYLPDYYGLGVTSNLPLLNRNQGNIKSAKSDIKSSESDFENQKISTMNDVISRYLQLQVTKTAFDNFDRPFVGKFDKYFQKLILNFQRRVIGLIEFIDFFETYRDTKLSSFNLEQDFFQAQEQLNFSIGKDVIK